MFESARAIAWLTGCFLALSLGSQAQAQTTAGPLDILAGETIRFIIGGSAGGTTDAYARPFLDELKAVLPHSTVLGQNLQGGAGALALIEANAAKPTTINLVVIQNSVIADQVVGSEQSPVDLKAFHPIGSFTHDQRLITVRTSLGPKRFDELVKFDRPLVLPVVNEGGSTHNDALVLAALTGLPLHIVIGVEDELRQTLILAGESDLHTNGYVNLRQLLDTGVIVPVLRMAKDGYPPELDDVPTLADVAPRGAPGEVLEIVDSLNRLGRLLLAAPSTDPAVIEALRIAFDQVMASARVAEAYRQRSLVLIPTGGAEVELRMRTLLADPSAAKTFQALLDCGRRKVGGEVIDCIGN
jgi:tripartite-type tricarboxylate transporter receptor subunit TctC